MSPGTWMLMYAAYCSWLGYGLRTHSPSQVAANVVAILLSGWLLVSLLGAKRVKWVFLAGTLAVASMVVMSVSEPLMNAILLGFEAAFVPQVVRSFRAWRSATPIPSVSMLTWSLSAASSLLWLGYAVAGARPLVGATSLAALAATGLILCFTFLANASVPGPAAS